jgi:hypothetical protein
MVTHWVERLTSLSVSQPHASISSSTNACNCSCASPTASLLDAACNILNVGPGHSSCTPARSNNVTANMNWSANVDVTSVSSAGQCVLVHSLGTVPRRCAAPKSARMQVPARVKGNRTQRGVRAMMKNAYHHLGGLTRSSVWLYRHTFAVQKHVGCLNVVVPKALAVNAVKGALQLLPTAEQADSVHGGWNVLQRGWVQGHQQPALYSDAGACGVNEQPNQTSNSLSAVARSVHG